MDLNIIKEIKNKKVKLIGHNHIPTFETCFIRSSKKNFLIFFFKITVDNPLNHQNNLLNKQSNKFLVN